MTSDRQRSIILIVEDEHDLADVYALWLEEAYTVRIAYRGEEAIEKLNEDVDVVLLDRRMPDISGEEFLAYVREQGYDCQVIMVSAVDPDFDILEMGFDEYVQKPVQKDELIGAIERVLTVDTVAPTAREYFSKLSKKEALESQKDDETLAENEGYADLLESIDSFQTAVLSLAEAVLENKRPERGFDRLIRREKIEEWQRRREQVDESDPLYDLAEQKIREYEDAIDEQAGKDVERELLELVAESFVASGFWLDSRILRALNASLRSRPRDVLVVNRVELTEGVMLSSAKLFDISHAVREEAQARLRELDDP